MAVASPTHKNLLHIFGSRKEAYEQLQRDQVNNLTHFKWYGAISVGALVSSALNGQDRVGWGLLAVGILFAFAALQHWIDASNRNFLMHAIDFSEHDPE